MRLVGTYEFVGQPPKVSVDVVRNPSYPLTPAIVQRASLATLLSADGTSQTEATFQILTKAPYLEVELPDKASLWSAVLDGTPLKPQRQNKIRLIGLPPSPSAAPRNLQIVYEAPVESLASGHRLSLFAPKLLYRAGRDATQSTPIPLVNIEWKVTVPDGYEAVATDGTLEAQALERPLPAPMVVAATVYGMGGGVGSASEQRASDRLRGIDTVVDDSKSTTEQAVNAVTRGSPQPAADAAPSSYSPSRRSPTQDNMTSDLPDARRDYAQNGGETWAVTDKVAATNGLVFASSGANAQGVDFTGPNSGTGAVVYGGTLSLTGAFPIRRLRLPQPRLAVSVPGGT